jgi:hypothetical protein
VKEKKIFIDTTLTKTYNWMPHDSYSSIKNKIRSLWMCHKVSISNKKYNYFEFFYYVLERILSYEFQFLSFCLVFELIQSNNVDVIFVVYDFVWQICLFSYLFYSIISKIIILYFMIVEIRSLRQIKCSYFRQFWCYIQWGYYWMFMGRCWCLCLALSRNVTYWYSISTNKMICLYQFTISNICQWCSYSSSWFLLFCWCNEIASFRSI